jgi:ABC-2 type transport system permease protein
VTAGILALTGAVIWAVGRVAGTGISAGLTAAGALGLWPFARVFAGVALLAGGVLHRSATVTGVSSGVLVGMYAIDLAAQLADPLAPLRFISAFHYYGAPLRDGLDVSSCAVMTVAAVALAGAGAALLERRDIGRG